MRFPGRSLRNRQNGGLLMQEPGAKARKKMAGRISRRDIFIFLYRETDHFGAAWQGSEGEIFACSNQRIRRGSAASRTPSPTRLKHVTVVKRAMPGKITIHQSSWMRSLPSLSNPPHEAWSGGTPKPRNERVDSARMAPAIPKEAETRTGPRALGRMWRKMIRKGPPPRARTA